MVGSVYPGIEVNVGFEDPAGKTTGKLFPIDEEYTTISIDGVSFAVTLVDAGAPCVYVHAGSLGLDGKSRDEWTAVIDQKLDILEKVRRQASVIMGLSDSPEQSARAIPKLGLVGKSQLKGADIRIQMLSMGKRHPAMPVTGSVALTLSARYADTTIAKTLGNTTHQGISLDTPSGLLKTFATDINNLPVVGISRTCRTIAQTEIHVPLSPLAKEILK